MSYAKGTDVPVAKSMEQLRALLVKNGSDKMSIGESSDRASIRFVYEGYTYRFDIWFPLITESRVQFDRAKRKRTAKQMENYIEAERKRLWRALLLYVTAAIEAHKNGLVDLKRSFMANLVTHDGVTLYDAIDGRYQEILTDPKTLLE